MPNVALLFVSVTESLAHATHTTERCDGNSGWLTTWFDTFSGSAKFACFSMFRHLWIALVFP